MGKLRYDRILEVDLERRGVFFIVVGYFVSVLIIFVKFMYYLCYFFYKIGFLFIVYFVYVNAGRFFSIFEFFLELGIKEI